jgi:agmatine deiminase
MISRRQLIKATYILLGSKILTNKAYATNKANNMFYFPDESHPHKKTWMAFVANESIWSQKQIPEVKRNLALIANTIAKYEPVSVLVNPQDLKEANKLLNIDASNYKISIHQCDLDDLWLRDTGPSFVINDSGQKLAIDFNFNGWGNKQAHSKDKHVAEFIAKASKTELRKANIVLEGGCFEVDGAGTSIMAKSCILNENRNPGWSQTNVEDELMDLLGLRKIIWLEGIKGMDITDGHTDFYARFKEPGQVIVSRENFRESFDYEITRENIKVLSNSVDADGQALKLHIIDTPNQFNERFGSRDFAAGYIGYYICNGAVIAQKFGDMQADAKAYSILKQAFPNRVIEQISIDGIASGGGSIHCATQQEPAT